MDISEIIKAGAGWYVVLLPVALILIALLGGSFVDVLRFVLETLNGIGGA